MILEVKKWPPGGAGIVLRLKTWNFRYFLVYFDEFLPNFRWFLPIFCWSLPNFWWLLPNFRWLLPNFRWSLPNLDDFCQIFDDFWNFMRSLWHRNSMFGRSPVCQFCKNKTSWNISETFGNSQKESRNLSKIDFLRISINFDEFLDVPKPKTKQVCT